MGADITLENVHTSAGETVANITVRSSSLKGTTVGGDIIPRLIDELPIIAVAAVCTFLTRALPFMIFKNAEALPRKIVYLGNVLPMAIMLCLIIYCVRNTSFFQYPYGLPELLGIGSVVLLHVWKRNNMISIIGGTLLYMVLVQLVFV